MKDAQTVPLNFEKKKNDAKNKWKFEKKTRLHLFLFRIPTYRKNVFRKYS